MANIIVIDDDLSLREVLEIALTKDGHLVRTAANTAQARSILKKESIDIALLDLRLGTESGLNLLKEILADDPEFPVLMITAFAETQSAIQAMKIGAQDYISKPFELDELILTINRTLDRSRLLQENDWLKGQIKGCYSQIIGNSPAMKQVFSLIKKIAPTQINVLITGESGTGKELIARAIHRQSERADNPFLPINCGGLPENLIESELFGYRKGAFTGADRSKKGLFEMAESGTVFLDEIAELDIGVQVKLLRCIQERSFIPLGATAEIKTDVRILAATNRSVEEDVAHGKFREDLYYRLSGVIVKLPPLRDREDDVRLLAQYFLDKACQEQKKNIPGFSSPALNKLRNYDYPGNVRELENIIERAVALESADQINPESLIIYEQPSASAPKSGIDLVLNGQTNLDNYLLNQEQAILQEALNRTNGHKGQAAKLVGLNFRQFRYRLTKTGLDE